MENKFSEFRVNFKSKINQLENEKVNLQIKLDKTRSCCKCYECTDTSCINNIWYYKNGGNINE